ncbi:MAG: ATP synthase subunit I [Pseudomonadota bacterium]
MAAVELPGLRRVAYGVVLAQLVLTVVLALICLRWGRNTALSAAIGGGIGAASNLTLALMVFGRRKRALAELIRAFYVGEAAKIVVTIVLFVLVLATLKGMLVPGALFGAFVATFLVQWFVLPRAMRKLDSGQV